MNQGYYNNGGYNNGYNNAYSNGYYNNGYNNRMMPNNRQMPNNGQNVPMNNGNPNNRNMNNNVKKTNNNKGGGSLLPLIIVVGVLGFVAVVLLVLIFAGAFNKKEDTKKPEQQQQQQQTPVVTNKGQEVGTQKHGYITIPQDWVDFNDASVKDDTIVQYSTQDAKYIATVGYYTDNETNSRNAAAKLVYALSKAGIDKSNMEAKQDIKIGKYSAYKVAGLYPDGTYLVGYFFETEDNVTRTVMIEGPDKTNEAYNIPFTFKLTSENNTGSVNAGTNNTNNSNTGTGLESILGNNIGAILE